METIICNLNLFDINQHIYKHSDSSKDFISLVDTPIEELAENIAFQCNALNIKSVHLYGDKLYLEPIADDIKAFGKSVTLAEVRNVPVNRILKSKPDIDKYFGGK